MREICKYFIVPQQWKMDTKDKNMQLLILLLCSAITDVIG